jgi:hypothetical protein
MFSARLSLSIRDSLFICHCEEGALPDEAISCCVGIATGKNKIALAMTGYAMTLTSSAILNDQPFVG